VGSDRCQPSLVERIRYRPWFGVVNLVRELDAIEPVCCDALKEIVERCLYVPKCM
jgi:hypothetical protein